MSSPQKFGTIFIYKFPQESFIFKMLLIKVVQVIEYSDKKIILGILNWFLASKTDIENWKYPIFDSLQSQSPTGCQKILLGGSF